MCCLNFNDFSIVGHVNEVVLFDEQFKVGLFTFIFYERIRVSKRNTCFNELIKSTTDNEGFIKGFISTLKKKKLI